MKRAAQLQNKWDKINAYFKFIIQLILFCYVIHPVKNTGLETGQRHLATCGKLKCKIMGFQCFPVLREPVRYIHYRMQPRRNWTRTSQIVLAQEEQFVTNRMQIAPLITKSS